MGNTTNPTAGSTTTKTEKATSPKTPANLTTDVMTGEIGALLENRILALEKHFNLGENAIGCVFGRTPLIGGTNGTMMTYCGRIWLWNGLVDLASVTAPSIDSAINRAFADALVTLPQYAGVVSRATRVA